MRGYIASKMAFGSGKKTWAERRSENRAESIEGNYVRSSLQRLDNDDVLSLGFEDGCCQLIVKSIFTVLAIADSQLGADMLDNF